MSSNTPEVRLAPVSGLRSLVGTYVNVVGIVTEYSIPRKTRGTDMVMTFKIMDDSENEATFNMFMRESVHFPVITAAGDVIFLRRVLVKLYNNEPILEFSHHKSGYGLYGGANVGTFEPYLPRQACVAPTNVNVEVDRLREWRRDASLDTGPSVYEVVSIKDLKHDTYPDLLCKIVHICPGDGQMFVYVWDGTDAPSQSISPMFGEPYSSSSLALNTDFDQLSHKVIESFCPAGTILKVAVDVDDDNLAQHFHFNERWIRIRNIHYQCVDGLWKATSKNLKIRLLKHSNSRIQALVRNFKYRTDENGYIPTSYDPLASQLTEIIYSGAECELCTLLRVGIAPVGLVFKCIVRVLAFGLSEDDINFRLTIEDPTTRIHAFTPPVDGVHLFSGIKSREEFLVKFKKLIGFPENCDECESLSPPWIPCLITTSTNSEGIRTYQLICTKLA